MVARRVVTFVGTSLGILLMTALFLRYDPARIIGILRRADIRVLLIVSGLVVVIRVLSALTPAVLLGPPPAGRLRLWQRTRVFLAMQPVSLITPGRLADFLAMPILRSHYRQGVAASSIVLDRLCTLLFLLLAAPLVARLVLPIEPFPVLDVILLGSLSIVVALPFLLTSSGPRQWINHHLLRFRPTLFEGFGAHTSSLLHTSRGRLALNFVLTALKTLLSGLGLTLLARSVGIPLDLLSAVSMSVLIQIVHLVPISLQGIGLAEVSLVALFALNGLPEAAAFSIALTLRVLLLLALATIYTTVTLPMARARVRRIRPSGAASSPRDRTSS